MSEKRPGFSLAELIIVLVLTAVVFTAVVIFVRRARQGYDHVQTINNLKHVALACHSAHDVYRRLPPAYGPLGSSTGAHTIHYHLLPFVEQDNLHKAYNPAGIVPQYISANDSFQGDGEGVQNFAANLRVLSAKGLAIPYNADIDFGDPETPASWDTGDGDSRLPSCFEPRGTSYTILLATRFANNTRLAVTPGAPNCSAHAGRPYHTNGAFFGAVAAIDKAAADTSTKPNTALVLDEEWIELSRYIARPTPPGIRE